MRIKVNFIKFLALALLVLCFGDSYHRCLDWIGDTGMNIPAGRIPFFNKKPPTKKGISQVELFTDSIKLNHAAYLAKFVDEGIKVIPRSGAPMWSWQNSAALPVKPIYRNDTVFYDHGNWTELYLIKDNTIEQQFIIMSPIASEDSVIKFSGKISSRGNFVEVKEGWHWYNNRGSVTLGKVFAFDACRKIIPASMRVNGSESTIEISKSDLEEIAYPITVDPEIGTNDFRISTTGPDGDGTNYNASSAAVAHCPTVDASTYPGGIYLVVWNASNSGKAEIYAQRINGATGLFIGGQIRVSFMGVPDTDANYDASNPDVAASSSEFFIVWHGDDNSGALVDNENEVYGQRLDPINGSLLGSRVKISTTNTDGNANFDATAPAIAYSTTTNRYLVAWYSDHISDNQFEIFSQGIQADGTMIGLNIRLSNMGSDPNSLYDAFNPDVAWNSTNNQFMVAWTGDNSAIGDGQNEVFIRRVEGSLVNYGNTIGSTVLISDMGPPGSTLYTASDASIAYNVTNNNYLVVWSGDDNNLADDEFEIFGQLVGNFGAVADINGFFRISSMGPDGSTNYGAFAPAVDFDPNLNQFLVTWHGDDNSGGLVNDEFEIFGQLIGNTGTLAGSNFRLSDAGGTGNTTYNATFPAVSYNNSYREFLVSWQADDNSTTTIDNEFEIWGQRFAEKSTEPSAQASSPGFSSVTSSSFNVSFTAASGSPDGYLVLRKAGSSPTDVPADQQVYDVNDIIGTSTVAYVGSATNFSQSGLSANTNYHYDFFSYNGANSSLNYLATSPAQGNVNTLFAEPSTQGTFAVTSFGTNSIQINLNAGNGSNRLLVIKAGSPVDASPADGSSYTPNNNITIAPSLGSSNFVVGSGTGSVTISGLSLATVYHFKVFEFNGTGSLTNYNTTVITNSTGSRSTLSSEPTAQPTSINFTSIAHNSFTINFTAAAGPPSGYIGIRKEGSAPSVPADLPVDGVSYTVGNSVGGSSVAFIGNSVSFAQNGLTPETTYHYLILAYNGTGANINYRVTSPPSASQVTLATPPSNQPSLLQITNPTPTSLDLSFTTATGTPSGYVILQKTGSSPSDIPINGTPYTSGNIIGSSVVVAVGSSTSFSDVGLTPNTSYYYDIFSFNGSGATVNYLSSSPLEGNRSTLQTEPTAQPTAISFSSIGETSIEISFAPEASSQGYLMLQKEGAISTEVPTDANVYTVGQFIGSSKVIAVGSGTTQVSTGLNPGVNYFFRVFSYRGSGQSLNYLVTGPLEGNIYTLPSAPEALDASQISQNSFVASWNAVVGASSYRLDVSADDFVSFISGYEGKQITGALESVVSGLSPNTAYKYRVRAENPSGQSQNSLIKSATTLSIGAEGLSIGSPSVEKLGGEFKISITLNGGAGERIVKFFSKGILSVVSETEQLVESTTDVYSITASTSVMDELGLTYFFSATDASTISPLQTARRFIYKEYDDTNSDIIPFTTKLDGSSSTYEMFSVPYQLDDADVPSVFKQEYDKTKWRLFRYQGDRTIEYLNGFNSIDLGKGYWFNAVAKFDVVLGAGIVAEANQEKDLTLNFARGWNQIGNPFPFNVDWNQIKDANPSAGLNSLWLFENGQYVKKDVLAPWKGAFVFSDIGGTVAFGVSAKTSASGRQLSLDLKATPDEESWMLPLTLSVGGISQESGVGMHPEAKTSKDRFDEITIPRFFDYVEMNTEHKEFFAPYFAVDVIPSTNNYEWNFTANSNLNGNTATLRWDYEALSQAESRIALMDLTNQTFVDMKTVGSYEFAWKDGAQFKVMYNRTEDLNPGVTWLGQAFPNPFNDRITIPFLVAHPETRAEVLIYDLMGRKVKVLYDNIKKAGIHYSEWDGKNEQGLRMEGGVYLYQLRTKDGLSTPKRAIKR